MVDETKIFFQGYNILPQCITSSLNDNIEAYISMIVEQHAITYYELQNVEPYRYFIAEKHNIPLKHIVFSATFVREKIFSILNIYVTKYKLEPLVVEMKLSYDRYSKN